MKIIVPALAMVTALLSACSKESDPGEPASSNGAERAENASDASDTPTQIVARLFQAADLNQSGTLTATEAQAYMGSILVSKDSDDDGSLTLKEFQEWDAGFFAIAERGGLAESYDARKAEIFRRWDVNGDGQLTLEEFHQRVGQEFAAAPSRQQRRMTVEEFAQVEFVRDMAQSASR